MVSQVIFGFSEISHQNQGLSGDVNDGFDDNSTKVSLSCNGFITYKISASKDGVGVETEVEVDAEVEVEAEVEEQSLWTKWTTWSLWT